MGKRKNQSRRPVTISHSDSKQEQQHERNSNDTILSTTSSGQVMKARDSTYQSTSYGTIVHSNSPHNDNNNERESHVSSPINRICDVLPNGIEVDQSIDEQHPHWQPPY